MSKKFLFVIDNLGSGGAQNQLTLISSMLSNRDYDIAVFVYGESKHFDQRLIEAKIPIHRVLKYSKLGLNVIWELRKLISKNKYNVIISFLDIPNFYSILASKLAFFKGRNVISYRSRTYYDKLNIVYKILIRFNNKFATAIVANSHHERENLSNLFPHIKNKINTIYNIIPNNSQSKSKQSFHGKFLVVGSVSRFKNGLTIVKALNIMKSEGFHDFQLFWVGRKDAGIEGHESYITEMQSMIDSYGLGGQWNWVGEVHDVTKYYHECDVLIHASTTEGLPNVVCEAMKHGLPVIISDVLDHPILVQNEINGYLFEPTKPEELADRIIKMYYLDKNQYLFMSKNSMKIANELFDEETNLAKWKLV